MAASQASHFLQTCWINTLLHTQGNHFTPDEWGCRLPTAQQELKSNFHLAFLSHRPGNSEQEVTLTPLPACEVTLCTGAKSGLWSPGVQGGVGGASCQRARLTFKNLPCLRSQGRGRFRFVRHEAYAILRLSLRKRIPNYEYKVRFESYYLFRTRKEVSANFKP